MTKQEGLIKELDELGNVLYNKFGTDSYLERCTIHDLKTKIKALTIPIVSNNEVTLKAFVEEYIEAFEDGQGGDTALYRQAKSLL